MKRIIFYGALTVLVAGSATLIGLLPPAASAKGGGGGGSSDGLASLKTVPVPKPTNLATYVKNEAAAVKLGKALFWDMQAGGDGRQSCASCHSAAGADNRTRNTLNPHGIPNFVANALLTRADFPIKDSRVVGSAGVTKTDFVGLTDVLTAGFLADLGTPVADPVFTFNGHNVRQVTGRQAPSVVNSVYNFRFFWDGRARETFNGVNPGGATDPNARVLQVQNGVPALVQISIDNAAAASQAVGPPNNSVEMSWNGRTFPQLGKKMLRLVKTPLAQQMVAGNDSVLGAMSNGSLPGLNTPYATMVQNAFQDIWWNSNVCVTGDKTVSNDGGGCPNSFTVMEANFSLFWGLAIQMYESTLIANDTPFDKGALNADQLRGLRVFTNDGRCVNCHKGAELTKASVRSVLKELPFDPATGFFNTAVRPVAEDGGIQDAGIANQAMFKTPHLRNLEFTGPYFHNGSAATLRDVVDFYDRGGNFPNKFTDSHVRPLNLTEQQKTDLVHFLLALTDDRVKFERAPFDHPSLLIHNGADANGNDIDTDIIVPAVGARGRAVAIPTFLNLTHDEQFKPSPVPH